MLCDECVDPILFEAVELVLLYQMLGDLLCKQAMLTLHTDDASDRLEYEQAVFAKPRCLKESWGDGLDVERRVGWRWLDVDGRMGRKCDVERRVGWRWLDVDGRIGWRCNVNWAIGWR